ncbi:uncharacterized protein LOC127832432 [Dreissena polymorpha]|uniref:Uncharacterized protein n=1 Tax=Dreissena polymorpha TaxID=45954 RepID=A0A9D4GJG8_DREPO|nr:uncharacterized protein LOC127832432 [Dreissena polymorpha]KAH3818334.1 hypothetical protein DPMN_119940 [Dreissena polymorpha]
MSIANSVPRHDTDTLLSRIRRAYAGLRQHTDETLPQSVRFPRTVTGPIEQPEQEITRTSMRTRLNERGTGLNQVSSDTGFEPRRVNHLQLESGIVRRDTNSRSSTHQGSVSSRDSTHSQTHEQFDVSLSTYGNYCTAPIRPLDQYEEVRRRKIEEGIDIINKDVSKRVLYIVSKTNKIWTAFKNQLDDKDSDFQRIKDTQKRRIFTDMNRKIDTIRTVEQDLVQLLKKRLGTLRQGQTIQQLFDQIIQHCLRTLQQIVREIDEYLNRI